MTKVNRQTGRTVAWSKTIYGQPYSKANSRKLVTLNDRPAFIKSDRARRYLLDFAKQCPVLDPLFEGDVHVYIEIFYQNRRPDLDESLILDALQGRIYRNDRQVRAKTIRGGVDRETPRADIIVTTLEECVGAEHTRPVRGKRTVSAGRVRVDGVG